MSYFQSEEKKKKKVKKIELPIESCVPEMTKKQINELVEREVCLLKYSFYCCFGMG